MNLFGRALRRLSEIADVVRAVLRGSESIDGVDVYGRQKFRRAVRGALLLLRDKRLPSWDTINQYVGSIYEGRRTFVIVTAHPAFMLIDGPHSVQAPEYLAATIAFEACSVQLHRTYEADFPGSRVPLDIYSGSAAVERCEKAYRECLLALGKECQDPDRE